MSWSATAAAFPRKIPAGSSPDMRRPSTAPSAVSMEKVRCTASRPENSTASQKRPGAAWTSNGRSWSKAKPNSRRTTREYGTTWLRATLARPSMRRSLPATTKASRHTVVLQVPPTWPTGPPTELSKPSRSGARRRRGPVMRSLSHRKDLRHRTGLSHRTGDFLGEWPRQVASGRSRRGGIFAPGRAGKDAVEDGPS